MSYFCFGILTDWVSVSDRTNEAITFKSTSIPGFSQTPRVLSNVHLQINRSPNPIGQNVVSEEYWIIFLVFICTNMYFDKVRINP